MTQVRVQDTFDRANAASLGNTQTGQTWVTPGGGYSSGARWGINNNAAHRSTPGASIGQILWALAPAGMPDSGAAPGYQLYLDYYCANVVGDGGTWRQVHAGLRFDAAGANGVHISLTLGLNGQNGRIDVHKVRGGVYTRILFVDVPYTDGNSRYSVNRLTVKLVGSTIEVGINTTIYIDASHADLEHASYGSHVGFHSVDVWPEIRAFDAQVYRTTGTGNVPDNSAQIPENNPAPFPKPTEADLYPYPILTGAAKAVLHGYLGPTRTNLPESTFPPFTVEAVGFEVRPYIVTAGLPRSEPRSGAITRTRASISAVTASEGLPAPSNVPVSADFRWLCSAGRFSTTQWKAQGDTAVWTYSGPAGDPVYQPAYAYQGAEGQITRPALAFTGKGWLKWDNPSPPGGEATIGIVFTPKDHKGPYFGVLESDLSGGAQGKPFALRYVKGRLVVWSGGELASHRVHRAAGRPLIVMLTFNAATDTGSLVVIDAQGRTSKKFSLKGAHVFDVDLFLGKAGSTSGAWGPTVAVMDMLEVDYWPRALSAAEQSQEVSLMALSHGLSS